MPKLECNTRRAKKCATDDEFSPRFDFTISQGFAEDITSPNQIITFETFDTLNNEGNDSFIWTIDEGTIGFSQEVYIFDESSAGEQQITLVPNSTIRSAVIILEDDDPYSTYNYRIPHNAFVITPIVGTAADETLLGTDLGDAIYGYAGDDTIHGLDGDNSLYGLEGNDIIFGGSGAEFIAGSSGNDRLYGGANINNGSYSGTVETLDGGAGDDVIWGNSGADGLYGWTGNDTLHGGSNNDELYGEEGNDVLKGNGGQDVLVGGQGSDQMTGGNEADIFYFESPFEGVDSITDFIYTEGDTIYVLQSGFGIATTDDYSGFFFDSSTNTLSFEGTPFVTLQPNSSFIPSLDIEIVATEPFAPFENSVAIADPIVKTGTSGADQLGGDEGNDTIDGSDGDDNVSGFEGDDALSGGKGSDVLDGGLGNDSLNGGEERDQLHGGEGNDALNGGSAGDLLSGGKGVDTLNGGSGNDALNGGDDNDTVTGGAGRDRFNFYRPPNIDVQVNYAGGAVDSLQISVSDYFDQRPEDTLDTLDPEDFYVGTSAIDLSTRFIYNSTTGALFFDVDGSDSKAQVQIAALPTGLLLAADDISVTQAFYPLILYKPYSDGVDQITDFNVSEDEIGIYVGTDQVSAFSFAGLASNSEIAANQFHIGTIATSGTQRFIYDSTTGRLFFDLDGTGATAQVQIAQLSPSLALSHQNIVTFDESSATANLPNPVISINNKTAIENDGQLTFTATLSEASDRAVTVEYATQNGTATGSDFTAQSGTLTFNPGTTSQSIVINLKDDNTFESTESFQIKLSNAANAAIGTGTGTGTIEDNDPQEQDTSGKDKLKGTAGKDKLSGFGGNDTLIGKAGNDVLNGGTGDDTLKGDDGKDKLLGEDGKDKLLGGAESDVYTGGKGNDIFFLEKGVGKDKITDFKDKQDLLDLPKGVKFNKLDIEQKNKHTLISLGKDDLALLLNFDADKITAADFV